MQDYRAVKLGRCERRIMNIIYQCGHASVAHVLADLSDVLHILQSEPCCES